MPSRIGQFGRKAGALVPASWLRGFGRPAALTFHGVSDGPLDRDLQPSHHDARSFETIARALKANFDVLPLALLNEACAEPKRHRRSLFLTSDDGYANTLSTAAPILKALDLPWTLFVSTRHIESGEPEPAFIVRLFCAAMPAGRYPLPHLQALLLDGPKGRAAAASAAIAALKRCDASVADDAIAAMRAGLAQAGLADPAAHYPAENFLNWDNLRKLAAGGVAIGAHAHVHWPLNAQQNAATLAEQTVRPRELLLQHLGACAGFAYPHGNVGDIAPAAWRAVRAAGYEHAFTTLSGTLDAANNPFLLPRYSLGLGDTHVASLVPLLAAGNRRVARFESALL